MEQSGIGTTAAAYRQDSGCVCVCSMQGNTDMNQCDGGKCSGYCVGNLIAEVVASV